jgi:ribokinase
MAGRLVVVGSVNADLYVEIERLPKPGETILGANAAVRPGGKGANQAAAAARLGQSTAFIGQVGEDAFAAPLVAALTAAGVDCSGLASQPGETGQAMILLQAGGENSIILIAGANARWQAVPAASRAAVAGAGALLLQREIPDPVCLDAALLARGRGVPVIMDAGGRDQELPASLAGAVSLLSPNETELHRLSGMPTGTRAEVEEAARTLIRRGVGAVLVKLGARGCLLVDGGGQALEQAAFRVPVADTTGAGDCFTAAYTVALMEGLPAARRLAFACAAAALCVQRLGALPSMPERAEVERFLAGAAQGGRA